MHARNVCALERGAAPSARHCVRRHRCVPWSLVARERGLRARVGAWNMAGSWRLAAWCAASLAVPWTATAAEAANQAAARDCATRVTRDNLVPCALAASPDLRVEREAESALEGRRQAADTLLPS